ncbi:MAG: hypothetical protein FJ272_22800, partial [Planctomycetes bacterium]|nr:hypothetical protein [Planctomycetota bacterium]
MLRVWCCWLGLVGVALADGALDFEKDAAGGSPSGWAGTAVVVEKDAIGGKRSLLLTATKDNDVASSPPLPAKAGQKYLLTYRLKLNVQRGAFHVQFRCLDEQRRPLRPEWKYPYIESRKTSLANPILISQQVSLADVESATAFVQIVFKWYDSPLGEAWIDDVSWQPLAEKAQVRNARPLDIRSACNMGFRDEKEGDGVGGWTDQGENDLRNLKPGTLKLDVLPLEVIDPAKNDGRSCIVLGGGAKPNFPQRVSIPVGQRADRVFALHNSAWSGDAPGTPVVRWTLHHADGSTSSATLRVGKDMSDWWRCANTDNSVVAVTTSNAIQTPVCLNVAEIANPKPEQAIASIEIASAGRPMYGLVAVTLADGPPLMPWLKLQA